jgi:hypothetical protein
LAYGESKADGNCQACFYAFAVKENSPEKDTPTPAGAGVGVSFSGGRRITTVSRGEGKDSACGAVNITIWFMPKVNGGAGDLLISCQLINNVKSNNYFSVEMSQVTYK